MIEDLKLWARQKRNDRLYLPQIRKLEQEKGKATEAEQLIGEYLHFRRELVDEQRALFQARLLRTARRLYLPVPRYTKTNADLWERSAASYGRMLLTDEGVRQMLDHIRAERMVRRDRLLAWIAPLTGVIGALTGLLAVMRK
jgi:hypothetical protein